MMVSATPEVVRIMGVWVRRADAGLARRAAHNAAVSVADHQARRLDEARTLRDLAAVLPVKSPAAHAADSASTAAVDDLDTAPAQAG
jgi:hypothetical protein